MKNQSKLVWNTPEPDTIAKMMKLETNTEPKEKNGIKKLILRKKKKKIPKRKIILVLKTMIIIDIKLGVIYDEFKIFKLGDMVRMYDSDETDNI